MLTEDLGSISITEIYQYMQDILATMIIRIGAERQQRSERIYTNKLSNAD